MRPPSTSNLRKPVAKSPTQAGSAHDANSAVPRMRGSVPSTKTQTTMASKGKQMVTKNPTTNVYGKKSAINTDIADTLAQVNR